MFTNVILFFVNVYWVRCKKWYGICIRLLAQTNSRLKELSQGLVPIYTLFFQPSLDQGTIPSDWKMADVVHVPMYKKADHSKPEN